MTPPALLLGWRESAVTAAIDLTGTPPVVAYAPGDKDWYEMDLSRCERALFVESTSDVSQLLAAMERAGLGSRTWAGVVPISESQMIPAAILARLFGCPGPDLNVAFACRDKVIQKGLVAAAGIPVARQAELTDIQEVAWGHHPLPTVPLPVVLKPIAGCGTVATMRANTPRELDQALHALGASGHRTFVMESLVEMDEEWEVDAVVVDGAPAFISVGVYGAPNITITDGVVHRHRLLDPVDDASAFALASALTRRAVAALGVASGVIHLEAYHRDGNLVFGECALRPAGGLLPNTVLRKHGVDLFAMHVAVCCGRRPEPRPIVRPGAVGFTHLPASPGVLVRHPSAAEIEQCPGVVEAVVQAPAGARLRDSSEGLSIRTGMVMLEAESADALSKRTDDLLAWVAHRLVVDPDATPSDRPVWLLRANQLTEVHQ